MRMVLISAAMATMIGSASAQEAVSLVDWKANPAKYAGTTITVAGAGTGATRERIGVSVQHETAGFITIGGLWSKKSGPEFERAMRECGNFGVRADGACDIEMTGTVTEYVKGMGEYYLANISIRFIK